MADFVKTYDSSTELSKDKMAYGAFSDHTSLHDTVFPDYDKFLSIDGQTNLLDVEYDKWMQSKDRHKLPRPPSPGDLYCQLSDRFDRKFHNLGNWLLYYNVSEYSLGPTTTLYFCNES